MSLKLELSQLTAPDGEKTPLGNFSYKRGETLLQFRQKLELCQLFESEFQFWSLELNTAVNPKLEQISLIEDFDGKLIVIEANHLDNFRGKKRKLDEIADPLPSPSDDFEPSVDLPPSPSSDVVHTCASSLVSSVGPLTALEKSTFDSTKLLPSLEKELKNQISKLIKQSVASGHSDHDWKVRTWDDMDEIAQVRLLCLECGAELGGGPGEIDRGKIVNMFVNFRNKHRESEKHKKGFAKRRGLIESLISKPTKSLPDFNHRQEIDAGVEIVTQLNGVEVKTPFVIEGDVTREPAYAHGHRVRCVFCGNKFELVPKQRNLEHNLSQHLTSQSHLDAVTKASNNSVVEPPRSGQKGRPKVDKRDMKGQLRMTDMFTRPQSSVSNPPNTEGTEVNSGLSLLCWGLWFDSVIVMNKSYEIKSLLHDQKEAVEWYSEPYTVAFVMNPSSQKIVAINGLFRNRNCARVSILGGGFENLCCSLCHDLVAISSFRLRLRREVQSLVPRGERTSGDCIRLDYLQYPELRAQAQAMGKGRRGDKFLIFTLSRRICALQTRRCKLTEMLGEAAYRKDLKLFLRNICNAHRTGSFGGKDGLWDFMQDLGKNLNCHAKDPNKPVNKQKGHRFSNSTRAISQALFHFGGRQVVQVMQLNLVGPSLRTLKRDKAKLVPFRPGVHRLIFAEVGKVLAAAKLEHNIVGDVPVILAEDETRIKPRIRWEAKRDTLLGFCGPAEEHVCSFGLEVSVGSGEAGYSKIFDSFHNLVRGSYARVVMVNPLHQNLPKMALCVSVTCNCFNASWVREHWKLMDEAWDLECRDVVGPVIGHASDGDGRRRKLMLEDYRSVEGERFSLGWEGWSLTGRILENGDIAGLGDQDPPHNGKKLVNPLDRSTDPLVLGAFHASLSHLYMVYSLYPVEKHGLTIDDVVRRDRQNWAGPQRLASRKVLTCLRDLGSRDDEKRERTLGTEVFMEIVGDYIDIHYSEILDLYDRVVLCGKVSFFFRLWRLWLRKGNHYVSGSTNPCSEKNMVSLECYHDVQISMHFVVLLIRLFRDKYSSLPVPLHLVGSDVCEDFFSRVGGMRGYERSYDFVDLVDCASGLNRLSVLEYGDANLKVGKHHSKQATIWGKLHPLPVGQKPPDLSDFSKLASDSDVVNALKVGFAEAQNLLIRLEMCPHRGVKDQVWWKQPWIEERNLWAKDKIVLASVSNKMDDQSVTDIFREGEEEPLDSSLWDLDTSMEGVDSVNEEGDEEGDDIAELGHEARHVFSELLSELPGAASDVSRTVTFEGMEIYKSTLISQLAGNPTLSKDRLTRIKQTVVFNGVNPKKRNADDVVCILDIGSDCGVLFDTRMEMCPATRSNRKGKGKAKGKQKLNYVKEIWYGRVQKIRRKYNGKWGKTKMEIDLLDRPVPQVASEGSVCQVMFNWYTPLKGGKKFLYETTDLQWIDIEMVISTVSMKVEIGGLKQFWILDPADKSRMDEFLASH